MVISTEQLLLRWLLYENRGIGGVLPPIQKLAIRMGVGRGVIREALKRLEGLGIVRNNKGGQLEVVPAQIAFSLDALPSVYRAAPSHGEQVRVVKAWVSLKWLVMQEGLGLVSQFAPAAQLARMENELSELLIDSREGEDSLIIVNQEMYVGWLATRISDEEGLKAIANGLVRCIDPLEDVWPTLLRPSWLKQVHLKTKELLMARQTRALWTHLDLARRDELQFLTTIALNPPGEALRRAIQREREAMYDEVTDPGSSSSEED